MNATSDRQGRLVGEVSRLDEGGRGQIRTPFETFYFNGAFLEKELLWEELKEGTLVEFTRGEGSPLNAAYRISRYTRPARKFEWVQTSTAIVYPCLKEKLPLMLGVLNRQLGWRIDYDEEFGLFVVSSKSSLLPAIEIIFDGYWVDAWPLYQVVDESAGDKRLYIPPGVIFREVASSLSPFVVFGRRYHKAFFEVFARPQSLPQPVPLWPPFV